MILLVHILFGAAIGSIIINTPLAIFLAFLSHYFLDLFPHIEYNIEISNKKQWGEKLWSITKIAIDFFSGLLLIFLLSKNNSTIYICAFFSIIPDGLTVLSNYFPNKFLMFHYKLHTKVIHFLKYKKISPGRADIFGRILSQILILILSIIILKL